MTDKVRRKLETRPAQNLADDPFGAFREVEILQMDLAFTYRHSLGKLSRFFLALEERKLLGTICPTCGTVWLPPRPVCPDDMTITTWVELGDRATLAVGSVSAYRLKTDGGDSQLALGYVAVEGASSLLLQQIRNLGDRELAPGLPLKLVWSDEPVDHPMELFWFEPA
ncbi:MAG: zinc ribbon domain-containing protein [Pseudomonadota bacterium]